MNITMTGNLGSGKTSVCKELKEMGYEIISAGGLFRQLAEERGRRGCPSSRRCLTN